MVKVIYTIKNEEGLHARPAAEFCKTASRFESKIKICKDGEEFEGKSILMVMCAGAIKGDTIEIVCDGIDEKQAADALVETLDRI